MIFSATNIISKSNQKDKHQKMMIVFIE